MFSGTGFFTRDGRPAIVYHGEGSGRNWIQFSKNNQLNAWSKPLAIVPKKPGGTEPEIRHWDPDLWIRGDTYYALSGGRNPQLMRSDDLKSWLHLGDVLHEDYPSDLGVPRDEDISCANFFRIGDKWMLLCISHSLGCRYYLGDFEDEKFLPESHAMMSWGGNQFFAPESVLTGDGRRIMWAWIMNLPTEPTGVQSLPRKLELPEDGVLRIRPLRELAKLRHDEKSWNNVTIVDGSEFALEGLTGDAVELEITFAAPVPENVGLHLLGDAHPRQHHRVRRGEPAAAVPQRRSVRRGDQEQQADPRQRHRQVRTWSTAGRSPEQPTRRRTRGKQLPPGLKGLGGPACTLLAAILGAVNAPAARAGSEAGKGRWFAAVGRGRSEWRRCSVPPAGGLPLPLLQVNRDENRLSQTPLAPGRSPARSAARWPLRLDAGRAEPIADRRSGSR